MKSNIQNIALRGERIFSMKSIKLNIALRYGKAIHHKVQQKKYYLKRRQGSSPWIPKKKIALRGDKDLHREV